MENFDEVPVFSPVGTATQLAPAHPTCNHALVADLFEDDQA
ncbi:hypothetical protein [Nonomuraea sp. KM90]